MVEPAEYVEIEFYPEPAVKTNYTDLKEITDIQLRNGKLILYSKLNMNRLIALKIKDLPRNRKSRIVCKLWAKNIKHKSKHLGQIYFSVMPKDPNIAADDPILPKSIHEFL